MADLNIDSLKLEIASDSQSADRSISNLITSLNNLKDTTEKTSAGLTKITNSLTKIANVAGLSSISNDIIGLANSLKHLNGVDVKANGVSSFTSALARLGKTNTSALASDMNSIAQSITNVGNATTKQNGINSFVNSLIRFSKVNVDTSTFSNLADTITQIGSTSDNGVNAIKSLNSFIRSSEKMKDAAGAFPELSAEIREFYDALSAIPIGDNTVRLAEALAEISKNGGKASTSMNNMTETLNKSSPSFRVASVAIDSIAEGFKTLVDVLRKAGSSVASGIGAIASKIKELTSHTPKVNQMNISFKQLLTTLIGFRGVTGVFNWAKDALTLGGDITEIDHIVESVFSENMIGYVEDWANSAIENFGIAAGAAKKYAGTLTAMFQSNNIAMDDAGKMSLRLVELAGDLSAFYNIDTETAYNKIKSGMAGMVRPLRDLGIDLSAATLKEYALAQGIEKNYSAMTQAEKIMLRYKYILEQTETQQSDFKRTSESFANSLRTLRAYLNSVTTQIGVGLAAAIRPAIVALNHLMKYIVAASKAFATFMQTIFGKYKGGASGMAIDASQFEDASDYTSDLADSAEGASSGIEDADDAAKKLKKDLSVLPFDELNQLSKDKSKKNKDDDDGGGFGLADLGGLDGDLISFAVDEVKGKLGELETFVSNWGARIKAAFDAKNWVGLGRAMAWGFNKGIDALYKLLDPNKAAEKINPFIDAFTTTFNSFVDEIHWETLGRDIGNGINILVDALNRILDPDTGIDWENIGKKLAAGANGLFDQIEWDDLGKFFANKINFIWEIAEGFVNDFDWKQFGDSLAEGANAFVDQIDFDSMADTVWKGLNGLTDTVTEFLDDFDALNFGEQLGNAFHRIISDVNWENIGNMLAKLWNEAWEFLKGFIMSLGRDEGGLSVQDAIDEKLAIKNDKRLVSKNKIGTGLGQAIHDAMTGAINSIKIGDMLDAVNGLFQKVFQDMQTVFGDTENWYKLGQMIGQAIAGILGNKDTMKEAAGALKSIANAIGALFKGAIEELSKHADDIKEGLSAFFEGLPWNFIFKAAAIAAGLAFVKKIPLIFGGVLVKRALKKTISSAVGEAIGSSVAGAGSAGSAVAGKSFFGSLIDTIGLGGVEGGAISAVVAATAAVQKLNDAARGGNGKITEEGGIWDSFINKLETVYGYSKNDTQAIFDLKEQLENGEIREKTFISKVAKELENMGVSSELAKNILGQVSSEVNTTDRQMELMESTISKLDTTTSQAAKELELFGDKKTAIEAIGTAFSQAGQDMNENMGEERLFAISTNAIARFKQMANGGEDLKTALSKVITEFNLTEEEVDALRKHIDLQFGEGMYDTLMSETQTASSKMGGFLASMASSTTDVSKALKFLADDAKKIPSEIATGVTHTQGMPTAVIEKMSGEMLAKMTGSKNGASKFETKAEEIPKGAASGIAKATKEATGAVETMANDMVSSFRDKLQISSPSRVFSDEAQRVPEGVAQGIVTRRPYALQAVTDLVSAMKSEFDIRLDSLETKLNSRGESLVTSLSDGMDNKASTLDFSGKINNMFSNVWNELSSIKSDFYSWGQSIAQSLSNGISSIKLPTLEYYQSGTSFVQLPNNGGYVHLPKFSPKWNWYAKGGLFTDPSIIGIGEAGKEAALPLENKRTMSMVADAITSNMKGVGLDERTLTNAFINAIMATSSNTQQDPTFNITIKTMNDEVLARTVQRGNQKLSYRNNPSLA